MPKKPFFYCCILLAISLLCLPVTADKKKDRNRGRIILAGVVHAPHGKNDGGARIAKGIGAVPGVSVQIVGTEFSTTTDKNGLFFFTRAPRGEVTLQLSKAGFQSVSETAEVDPDTLDPTTLSIQILPADMNSDGKHLSGSGVLYVAYSRSDKEESGTPESALPIFELLKKLAAGGDPLGFEWPQDLDLKRPRTPWTLAPNHLMIYPPATPSRTTFHTNFTSEPYYLTFDGSGDYLFVADNSSFISVHDVNNRNKKLSSVTIPHLGRATSLTTTPDGQYVLATIMGAFPGILVIDTTTQQQIAYLKLHLSGGSVPTSVTPVPNGPFLVTAGANAQAGELLILDPYLEDSPVISVKVGEKPRSCSVTPDGKTAFVANSNSGNVSVIDLSQMSVLGTIQVGAAPVDTALTPDGQKLLVANQSNDSVSVIDVSTRTVIKVLELPGAPTRLVVTRDGKSAYVTNRDKHTVSTIDLATLEVVYTTEPMPRSRPTDLAIRP